MQPTLADKNYNPGNLRDPKTGAFRTFSSESEGYAALMNDLQSKVTGNTSTGLIPDSTLYDFSSVYAPSSDKNHPAQYTANLANSLGVRPDTKLSDLANRIPDFAQAIARNEGYSAARNFTAQQQQPSTQQNTQVQPSIQPSIQPQGKSVTAFMGNVINGLGNIGDMVMHPLDTAQTVIGTVAGAVEKPFGVQNEDTQKFDLAVDFMKQRYGGSSFHEVIDNIVNTFYTDPVGAALDLSTLIDGLGVTVSVASKVSRISELAKVSEMLKTASSMVNPISGVTKVASKAIGTASNIAKFGTAQAIGVKTDTVTNIIKNWDKLSKEQRLATDRMSLAEDFGKAIDTLDSSVKDSGAGYNKFRTRAGIVSTPENFLEDILTRGVDPANPKSIPFGLKVARDPETGRMLVSSDTNSFTRNPSDIAAIQNFVDTWGNKLEMTPNEFLQMRSDADAHAMAKFGKDIGKNSAAELVGRDIQAKMNKFMRPQVKGLSEHDTLFAPDKKLFNQVKKDFLTVGENGVEFKPGALNKIANATGKGKDILLQRMEHVAPGITERITLLKTVEDIESALDIKTGTYLKSGLNFAAFTGNAPAIITAIISHPNIAVPLLRGLGWSKAKLGPIVAFLKQYANSGTLRYPLEINNAVNQNK